MTSDQITHLQFIQAIIDRMNRNSFQLKGLCVTITTALIALYANSGNWFYVLITIVPTVILALLDAYYLLMERKFRGVYRDLIENPGRVKPFDMPIHLYSNGNYSYIKVVFSKTIFCFYFLIILASLIGGVILSSFTVARSLENGDLQQSFNSCTMKNYFRIGKCVISLEE